MSITVSMSAGDISTALQNATCLPSDMKSADARDLLGSLRFDQAPVMRDGRLVGWVLASHLVGRGIVEARTKSLDQCAILARETPVGDAIAALASEAVVFLAGPKGIGEFIVSSDLDRHPVRCYLYVLLSGLEMRLADLAEAALTEDDLKAALGSENKRYRKAVERGVETRVVEYLNFSAYENLAPTVPGIVAAFPGAPGDLSSELRQLRELRNHAAHPTKPMAALFDSSVLAHLSARAEAFLEGLRNA